MAEGDGATYSDSLVLADISHTLRNLQIISAAQAILGNLSMRNAKAVPTLKVKALHTYTAPGNAQTVVDQTIASSTGSKLAVVNITADTNFSTNYFWLPQITGITDANTAATWQAWDPNSTSLDIVPGGRFFLVPNGATVKVQAYNAVSGNTNDGYLSVYIAYDRLSVDEALVLNKYAAVLKEVASIPGSSLKYI